MKKLMLMLAAVATLTLSSCGGSQKDASGEAADANEVVSELTESLKSGDAQALQGSIEKAQAYIAELQASGKVEEAKTYVATLQEWLNANADQVKSVTGDNATISTVIDAIKAIPTDAASDAAETLQDAAEGVEAVQQAGEELKEKGEELKEKGEAVKEAIDAAPEAAKQAVEQTKESAKQAGKDAVNGAIDNAASKLKLK